MHFYKQMCGFYMHSVCLPEKLTAQLSPLTGKFLELKLPSGDTWQVSLVKCGPKLALQDGWYEFARDNCISQNDLLVFKFKGGSEFEVVIFDSNGCEKSFEGDERNSEFEEPIDDDFMQVGTRPEFSNSGMYNCSTNSSSSDLNETEEEEEEEGDEMSETEKSRKKFGRKKPENGVVPNCDAFYSPQGLFMTKEQIKKAKELSKEIKKGNPTFLQVLKPAHLTSRFSLSVPRHFCKEFLPKERRDFILRRPNKKKNWTVRCNYNKKHHEIRWIEFVRENNLLEDDICLFELDKSAKNIKFTVHVTRV